MPVLAPNSPIVDLDSGQVVSAAHSVQTPQVFSGPDLIAAFEDRVDVNGHDTVDVVQRFGSVRIAAVAGDPRNIKVTYPADLARVIR